MTIELTPAQVKYLHFVVSNDLETLETIKEEDGIDGSHIAEAIHARVILAKLEQE